MPRVVTLYRRSAEGGWRRQETPAWLATKTLFSGGGGLWSTAEDYMQFAQMLVNGGELNGKRLLSPRTVELMASNHVGELYAASAGRRRRGMGFGLTVEVVDGSDRRQSPARRPAASAGTARSARTSGSIARSSSPAFC